MTVAADLVQTFCLQDRNLRDHNLGSSADVLIFCHLGAPCLQFSFAYNQVLGRSVVPVSSLSKGCAAYYHGVLHVRRGNFSSRDLTGCGCSWAWNSESMTKVAFDGGTFGRLGVAELVVESLTAAATAYRSPLTVHFCWLQLSAYGYREQVWCSTFAVVCALGTWRHSVLIL